MKIGQEMSTTFHGNVNFHGADIGGEFLADKAQFLGHISNFEAVKVGRSFHASGAIFGGSVYFSRNGRCRTTSISILSAELSLQNPV